MYKFILASASPRRKAILEKLNIPFEVMISGAEESVCLEHSPYEWVRILSVRKATAVEDSVKGPAVIIGADTIVTYLGKILNKPANEDDAFSMLRQLSGKKHTVYTGMTLIFIDKNGNREVDSYVDATEVTMAAISDEEIKSYISTGEYADKAGGYAVQGKSSIFIESIYGSYDTVVGLPTNVLYKALKDHGIDIAQYW